MSAKKTEKSGRLAVIVLMLLWVGLLLIATTVMNFSTEELRYGMPSFVSQLRHFEGEGKEFVYSEAIVYPMTVFWIAVISFVVGAFLGHLWKGRKGAGSLI